MSDTDAALWDEARSHETGSLFREAIFSGDKAALGAGLAVFLAVLGLGYLCLELVYSDAATRELAAALQSSALYFGGALITASITIVALMLNALGTARKLDADFDQETFLRIYRITVYATALLGAASLLMLLLFVPLQQLSGVPGLWYSTYYHALLFLIALAAGLVSVTGVELYRTVHRMIGAVLECSGRR